MPTALCILWTFCVTLPTDGGAESKLQAALEQHRAALAFFSCRVQFGMGGVEGNGIYCRTPNGRRLRSEWRGEVSDIFETRKELVEVNFGPHLNSARRRARAGFNAFNHADAWGKMLLIVNTPDFHITELADALPRLSGAKKKVEAVGTEGDLLLTLTYETLVHKYWFAKKYGYLPVRVLAHTTNRNESTTVTESLMSDFEELEPGVFFARRADYCSQYTSEKEPSTNKESKSWARLTDLSTDPKAGERYPEFKIPAGMPVRDEIDREYYQLDQNGKRLPVMKDGRVMKAAWDQARDEAKYLNQSQATQLADASALGPTGFNEPTSWPWVLGGSAVGVAVAAVVWFVRRRWFAGE